MRSLRDVVYPLRMAPYRAAIIERHRRAQSARRTRMRAEAARLAGIVGSQFPIRRLYLYGSVVDARPLAVWSDIDLAVEGLPPGRFLELSGALTAATEYHVDLKPMEELAEDQRRHIALQGVLLLERD